MERSEHKSLCELNPEGAKRPKDLLEERMDNTGTIEKVKQAVEPILTAANVELVELSYRREGGRMVLRFLVDKPGGITLDDCANLNHKLSQLLDAEGIIDERYTLEVSSPGVDRLLVNRRDFERAKGKLVKVITRENIGKDNTFVGFVRAADDEKVTIETESGEWREIPLGVIAKAKEEIRF